jgi:hypothetical protein
MKNIIKRFISCLQYIIATFSYSFTFKKEKRIIIGVTEIANILNNLKFLFQEKCLVVCKNRNVFYENNNYNFDISKKNKIIKIFSSAILFGKLAKKASFFIYLWSDGFFLNREFDFNFLKKRNIPITCWFLGDDVRSRKLFLDYCRSINFSTYVEYDRPELFLSDSYDNEKKALAEQADKYAAIIFSHKTDQYSYIKSEQYFFPPVINEKLISLNIEKFDKVPLRILHAPSSPVLKGTPLVRSVIKRLVQEGYEFQYIELINRSNEDVVTELNQSHIVLNQFYGFIPGIFGLESMATTNAVLMSAKHEHFPYEFNDAWVETEDWQLYDNLKYLLDNPKEIIKYAKNGYEYMSTNFSKMAIKKHLSNIFNKNGIDFTK